MANTPSDTRPAEYDLILTRGATEVRPFTYTDDTGALVNLTGYHARMQIRPDWLMPGTVPDTALVSLTDTTPIGIALGDALGTVVVTISDTITSALSIDDGVYDIELIAPSLAVLKFLRGKVKVLPEATV